MIGMLQPVVENKSCIAARFNKKLAFILCLLFPLQKVAKHIS